MVSAAGPCPLLVPSASLRSLSSSASLCACSQGDEQRDAQEGHHGGHREDLHGGEEGRARGAPCGAQCRVSEQMRARRACAAKGCGTRTHAPHARNGERRSQGNGIARTHSRCCTCACLSLGGGCLVCACGWLAPFRVSWARWELRPCGNHGTRESWLCEFRALPFVPNSNLACSESRRPRFTHAVIPTRHCFSEVRFLPTGK